MYVLMRIHVNACFFLIVVSHMVLRYARVHHLWWVLNLAFPLAGWVTLGATGAPTQCPGSSAAFFTRPRAAAFTRARQTDPLHAIKPSTREQRGQVLVVVVEGGCIEGSPAPSRGTDCVQPSQEAPPSSERLSSGANGTNEGPP